MHYKMNASKDADKDIVSKTTEEKMPYSKF